MIEMEYAMHECNRYILLVGSSTTTTRWMSSMSSEESINCSKECNHNHSLIQHAAGYDNDHDMICPSTYT